MTIKNFLLYLQVLTLTASIMNENTDLGKNRNDDHHQLTTGKVSKEFYRPGDINKLSSFISVNIKKPVHISKIQNNDQPKISPAKQFPNFPSHKITSSKFHKDKKLNQEYKRLLKANNPSKSSDLQPEPSDVQPDKQEFAVETPSVSSNNGENRIPLRLFPAPSYSIDGAGTSSSFSNGRLDNQGKTLCFMDSCVKLKSLIVPCQYMSRAFHFLSTCDANKTAIIFVAQQGRPDSEMPIQILYAHTAEIILTYENYFTSHHNISNINVASDDLRIDDEEKYSNETQLSHVKKDENLEETTTSSTKIPPGPEAPPTITEAPPTGTEVPPTTRETSTTSTETPPTITEAPPAGTEVPPTIDKDVLPEEGKQEEDISALKKDPDMPSFDEWKLQQEDQKEQTSHNMISHTKPKVAKKEINYASVTCGAKIIQANPEAQNLAFVLYENKDQYMNNPCSAKKGFTVELCESVQIQVFELGNMEFFSSNPQKFEVHVSERFPVKEWIHLGTFEAKNERIIQSFSVEQQNIAYAKYIRIDILSHYGSEHFCPLSVLRVFGVSLDDDDEVEISREETDFTDVIDVLNNSLSPDDPKLNNLFTKATDTVLSIMKTVLPSTGSPSNKGHDNDTDDLVSLSMQSNTTYSSLDASSDRADLHWKDQLQHCHLDFESLPVKHQPHTISRSNKIECVYYKLLCKACNKLMCPNTYFEFGNRSIESYMTHHNQGISGDEVEVSSQFVRENSRDVDQTKQHSDSIKDNGKSTDSDENLKSDIPSESKVGIVVGGNDDRISGTKVGSGSDTGVEFTDVSDKLLEKSNVPDCDDVSDDKMHGYDYDIDDSLKTTETGDQFDHKEENSRSLDVNGNKKHSTNFSNVAKATSTTNQSDGSIIGEAVDLLANHKKNNSAETPPIRLEPLKDYEFDGSNMDEITYQKLYSKGKESVFAKLRNRIKNLEGNLNLTNRYLEELSQRYKKQTEETNTSLNKTISKLINTAKSAEERDMRQQDRIQNLEMKLSNVSMVLASLHRSLQDIHAQVLERHVILMVIEFCFFLLLLTFCQSSRRSRRFHRPTGTVTGGDDEEYDGYSHLESSSKNQTPTCVSRNPKVSMQLVKELKLTGAHRVLCSHPAEPVAGRGDTSEDETKGEIQRKILQNSTKFQHTFLNSINGESIEPTAENGVDDCVNFDLKSFQHENFSNNNNHFCDVQEAVGLQRNIISSLPAPDQDGDGINESLSFVSPDVCRTKSNSKDQYGLDKSKEFLPIICTSSSFSPSTLLDVTNDSSNFNETSIKGLSVVNAKVVSTESEPSRNSAENSPDNTTGCQRVCDDEISNERSTTRCPKKRDLKFKKKVDVGSKWTAGVAGYFDRMSTRDSFETYRPQKASCYSLDCIRVQYTNSDSE